MTAALHVVDLILYFLFALRVLGSFGLFQQKDVFLENLSYIKKQQEQEEAQTKQYHQSNQQSKPVLTVCGRDFQTLRTCSPV